MRPGGAEMTVSSLSRVGTGALVALALMWSEPASAIGQSPAPDDAEYEVTFGQFEGGSADDWYQSLVESNDLVDVIAFLEGLEENPEVLPSAGLGELSDTEQSAFLAAAVSSAKEGRESLALDPDLSRLQGASAEPLTAAASAAFPVLGSSTNGGWSWTLTARANFRRCGPLTCSIIAWVDYRGTTNPGRTSTATSINLLVGGTGVTGVRTRAQVYRSGVLVGDTYNNWNVPGYGTHYSSHTSMSGRTFQAAYEVTAFHPESSVTLRYSTARTYGCKQPTGGAFRCIFP